MSKEIKDNSSDSRIDADLEHGSGAEATDGADKTEKSINIKDADGETSRADEAVQDVLTKQDILNATTMAFEQDNSTRAADPNQALDMEEEKSCISISTLEAKEMEKTIMVQPEATEPVPSVVVVEEGNKGSPIVGDGLPQPTVQPTVLRRTMNINQHQPEPGAHRYVGASREGGGANHQHPMDVVLALPTRSISNSGLVEARVVHEESKMDLLQEAQEVDVDERVMDRSVEEKKEQQCRRLGNAVIACVMCILVISLGIEFGTRNDNPPHTELPSVYLSMSPSEVPSSAPTQGLDLLFAGLPDSTQHRIQNGTTPQYQAWEWLSNHRNITNLPEWKKRQLFALATFYFAFEGEMWNQLIQERWMKDTTDECFWFSAGFGRFVDGNYVEWPDKDDPVPSCNQLGEFTWLDLNDLQLYSENGVAPSIPPEIALLTSLETISLYENGELFRPLTAVLPSEIYQMSGLANLFLYGNNITGVLPSELGLLTSLTDLELDQNHISGSIPSELGRLTILEKLHLYSNDLSGWLPSELGLMTSLTELSLEDNMLSGLLPRELGKITELTMVWLHSNHFSGSFPTLIGLTNLSLLVLGDNSFSGVIPDEMWQLSNLSYLDLSDLPQLTGPIELSFLSELGYLDLSGSIGLSGTIPIELCSLQNLSCNFFYISSFEFMNCSLTFDCTVLLCGCSCPCSDASM